MCEKSSVRHIDELGRVVIPLDIRSAMQWMDVVAIEVEACPEQGVVMLKRHAESCAFCGATGSLRPFRGVRACRSCIQQQADL